jgi:hypothetical protein
MSYNLNSIYNNNILNKLEKFMLNNDLIEALVCNSKLNIIENKEKSKLNQKYNENNKSDNTKFVKNNSEEDKTLNNEWIIVNKKDKKFWYFYMFINDLEVADLPLNNNTFKIESEEKIKLVEELAKTDNSIFKQYKINKKNIQSSLSNIQDSINLIDLIGLCILYKRNLIYICDNLYYEINTGLTSGNLNFDIIYKDKNGIEKIPTNKKKEELYNKIRNENIFYKIENISKPIKCVSSFTLSELKELAEKLNILTQKEDEKMKLKKDIYDEILNKFNIFK